MKSVPLIINLFCCARVIYPFFMLLILSFTYIFRWILIESNVIEFDEFEAFCMPALQEMGGVGVNNFWWRKWLQSLILVRFWFLEETTW